MGMNVREGYRTGAETYSAKATEGYPAPVPVVGSAHTPGGSRVHSVSVSYSNIFFFFLNVLSVCPNEIRLLWATPVLILLA